MLSSLSWASSAYLIPAQDGVYATSFLRAGPESRGAWLTTKWFPHDFGEYVEVVCYFTTDIEASMEYALTCEAETPATWDDV